MPALFVLFALFLAFLLVSYSSMLSLLWLLALSCFLFALSLSSRKLYKRAKYFTYIVGFCLVGLFALRLAYLPDYHLLQGSKLEFSSEKLQKDIRSRLERTELNQRTKILASAMALGHIERDSEGQAIRQEFIGSGVAHILAVSGFHLAIITGLIALLLKPLPYSKGYDSLRLLSLLASTWLFVWLTGASQPTIRAGFMLSLYLFGRMLRRPVSMLNILALSLLIQMLLAPSLIHSAGLWLSHIAVLSIYLFYPSIYELLPNIRFKPLRYLWQSMALTLAVQILIIPLCFYFFGGISWAFLLTTLPITCLATLFIPLALCCFLLNGFGLSPTLLENLLNLLSEWIGRLTQTFSSLDYFYQEFDLPLWALFTYYLLIFAWIFHKSQENQNYFLIK